MSRTLQGLRSLPQQRRFFIELALHQCLPELEVAGEYCVKVAGCVFLMADF